MTAKRIIKHMMLSTDCGRRYFYVKKKRAKAIKQGQSVGGKWSYL